MSKSQKQVVVDAVMAIMGSAYNSTINCGEWFKARPEQKGELTQAVISAFESGECELKSEQKSLSAYVSGLISNHLRKAKELNGGVKYEPANPGSRSGQTDPQIKAMRQLLKTLPEGSAEFNKVQSAIDAKISEIKAERQKTQIDVDNLPEDLRGLVG